MAFWQSQLRQRTYFAASSLPGMPVLSGSAFGFDRAGSPVQALARRIAEERLEQAVAKAWDKDLGASPAEYLDSLRGLDEVIDALAAGRVTSWSINLLSMSSRSTFSTMEDDYDPPNSPPWAEGDINNYVLHDTLGQCASVLDNDSDYDGPQPLTAIKKSDPARGTLSLNSDGTFTYLPTPNLEYYDSFTYAAFDGADESNVETVWVTVTNEYLVEGDDPDGDPCGYIVLDGTELVVESLRYNDFDPDGEPDNSQFELHILTQPTKGTITEFDTHTGAFRYVPNPWQTGSDSFTYYGDDGVISETDPPASEGYGTVRIDICPNLLTIYDGLEGRGGGNAVAEAEEKTVGAVTVANLNDTDADFVIDAQDESVVPPHAYGSDEVDLMKLVIHKPEDQMSGPVLVTTFGDFWLWRQSTKEEIVPSYDGNHAFQPSEFADGDVVVWAEITAPSQTVRDVVIYAGYEHYTDVVKATGVWAECSPQADVLHNRMTGHEVIAAWPDLNEDALPAIHSVDGTGLIPRNNWGLHNGIAFRFTLYPSDIGTIPRVQFDTTRQAHGGTAIQEEEGGEWYIDFRSHLKKDWPLHTELPNDDSERMTGESWSISTANHFFSYDAPGPNGAAQGHIWYWEHNFLEWMRVRVDGVRPAGEAIDGSRCSSKIGWHNKHELLNENDVWVRTTGDQLETDVNEIGLGFISVFRFPH